MNLLPDLAKPLRLLVGILFAAIVTLTIAQVGFRYLLDAPLIWSEELAKLFLVWMVFLGAAVVAFDGKHLDVDVAFKALPPAGRTALRWINLAVAVAFLAAMAWYSIDIIEIESWDVLGATELSAAWVRVPAAAGGVLIILALILRRATGGWRESPDDGTKPL